MNTHSPFVIEPFLARGHQADCRCAQCRHNGLAQEFLPLFAENVPARGSQYMFEVAPFASFSPTAATSRPPGNEAMDVQAREWGRPGQPTRRGAQPSQRPAPSRRPPARRLQRRARRPFPLFATDPTTVAAQGSEQVRWAQNALNQIMGLNLPVNGVLDKATRSAVRSFQRSNSLPASGIVGPDTAEALRAAFGGYSAGADSGGEYEEIEIGPLDITVEWSEPLTLEKAKEKATQLGGGGVYIVVGSLDKQEYKKLKAEKLKEENVKPDELPEFEQVYKIRIEDKDYIILKVGKTESFTVRLKSYTKLRYKEFAVSSGKLRFFLGAIRAVDPFAQTERALARLLINTDVPLPGSRNVGKQPVKGPVSVKNILPPEIKRTHDKLSGNDLNVPSGEEGWEIA